MRRRWPALLLSVCVVSTWSGQALAGNNARCASQDWAAFGRGVEHTFAVPDGCAAITTGNARNLAPAWFVPTTDSVTASPAVVDGTAYVGSWDGTFYAIDVAMGTVRWTYKITTHAPTAFGRIVSSATVATYAGKSVVIFGGGSSVWALEAHTGHLLATLDLDPRTPALRTQQEAGTSPPVVEVESSPAVATVGGERRIYVGLDVHNAPAVGRTGVVALQLLPGAHWRFAPLWKFDAETSQAYAGPAGLTVGSGKGWGCGGVWSSPAVDTTAGLVAFGTSSCSNAAQAYDAHENYAESMVAIDARSGALAWRYRPADELSGRAARIADAGRDADFGASPNLFRLGGRRVVGEGRKSADCVVRDLLTGTAVRTIHAGQEGYAQDGFGIGGFLGTPAVTKAADGTPRVVGATAIPVPHAPGDLDPATWSVRAIDPATGQLSWTYRLAGPSYGHTSVAGGVAFVPDTTNSALVALDAATGLPLWESPVVGPPSSTAVVVGNTVVLGTGTRETDAEYKAVNTQLQDVLTPYTGASPLSPVSGVQAFRLVSG